MQSRVAIVIAVLAGSLAGQSPRPFEPPKLKGDRGVRSQAPVEVSNVPRSC